MYSPWGPASARLGIRARRRRAVAACSPPAAAIGALSGLSRTVLWCMSWKWFAMPRGKRGFLAGARLRPCLPPWVVTSEVPLLSMQRLAFGVAFLAVLVLAAKPSTAQTWPQRAVKFIVTLGPGSGVD